MTGKLQAFSFMVTDYGPSPPTGHRLEIMVNPVRKDGFLNPPSLPAAGRKKG